MTGRSTTSILAVMSIGLAAAAQLARSSARPGHRDHNMGQLYSMLYCDEPELFRPTDSIPGTEWQQLMFSPRPAVSAILDLAEDRSQESWIRILAYEWLRRQGSSTLPLRTELLGVIVELPVAGGLDVLAVYRDGRIRYVNHVGVMVAFHEGAQCVTESASRMLEAAQSALEHGDTEMHDRRPPFRHDAVRLSFLTSSGLHMSEGVWPRLVCDPLFGPVLRQAVTLLGQWWLSMTGEKKPMSSVTHTPPHNSFLTR